MKTSVAASLVFLTIACVFARPLQAADVSVKISGVHLCCKACVNGVKKSVSEVQGGDRVRRPGGGHGGIDRPNTGTLQKAADALVAGGYFGKSSDAKIKLDDHTGAKGKKVKSLQVSGVHLCCGKCVESVDEAVKTVSASRPIPRPRAQSPLK
jgi:copper chaperone CopZ